MIERETVCRDKTRERERERDAQRKGERERKRASEMGEEEKRLIVDR